MSIGGILAEARQAAGLSVSDVSARTRIRAALIRAIEADDFAPCGGDFYARGHIRAIARAVGTDSRPLIADYDAARQEKDPPGALDDLLSAAPERNRTEKLPAAGPGRVRDRERPPGPRFQISQWFPVGQWFPVSQWFRAVRQPSRERNSRLPWLSRPAALLAVIALAVIAGGAYLVSSGPAPRSGVTASSRGDTAAAPSVRPRPSRPATTAPSPSPSASPPAAVTVAQVTPSGATAVGPGGAGGDNPDLAGKALAGHASSPWHTHWYTTAQFGNLQPGTGLLLTLPRQATVTGVTVEFGDSGGTMQVKAGTSSGSLRTVASGSAGGTERLSFARTPARYVELWFTQLGTDNGANQVSVYDVSVSTVSRS